MILNRMIINLANRNGRGERYRKKCMNIQVKVFFEIKSTTFNGNAPFAENKSYELGQALKYIGLPSPGSVFSSTPGRWEKSFFYHFETENITLILIYKILVNKKFFSGMNIKKIF